MRTAAFPIFWGDLPGAQYVLAFWRSSPVSPVERVTPNMGNDAQARAMDPCRPGTSNHHASASLGSRSDPLDRLGGHPQTGYPLRTFPRQRLHARHEPQGDSGRRRRPQSTRRACGLCEVGEEVTEDGLLLHAHGVTGDRLAEVGIPGGVHGLPTQTTVAR
jgi:hypothetical protein